MRQKIDEILASEFIALDTETTGLNVRKDRVIGVGAASHTSSIYIPLLVWDGTELKETPHLEDALYLLKALKSKKLILHNAAYDLRIIKHDLGIDLLPALYCDTILLKHTVDEIPPFGLKEIALKHAKALGYDRDPTIEKKAMEASITAAGGKHTKDCYELYKADANIIGEYCEQDCKLTLAVFDFYSAKLVEENLVDFYYKDEVLPLYKEVSIPMMERGIKLDIPRIKALKESIEKELSLLEHEVQAKLKDYSSDFKTWFFEKEYPAKPAGNFAQELAEHFNLPLPKTATGRFSLAKAAIAALPDGEIKEFLAGRGEISDEIAAIIRERIHGTQVGEYFININSKDHLKRIIFNFLGEKPERHTEKGAYQLDDDYLHSLESTYSFIPPLLVYNKLNKIRATYIDRFLEQSEDGIFYPQFNQHRTISGRFGSDIQQLPRKMEDGNPLVMKYTNAIREFFISRPFHSFVDIDYESLEPHIFSAVSGDKGLQDIFNLNQDFYSTIAIMTEKLQGVSADKKADNYLGKVNKAARQKSKSYCLGVPYGMGSFKLSKELNISQDEAQRLIDQYMKAFPNLKKWMDTTDDSVKKLGYVTSLVGRKRRMPEAIEILHETGPWIFDSLEIWKQFHESPTLYEEMKDKRRKITNYINNGRNFQIQSLGASVINRACIAIARRFKELKLPAHITLQCHDEVLVECKTEQKELIAKEMQFIMENIIELPVKLKAPPSFGTNYANAK